MAEPLTLEDRILVAIRRIVRAIELHSHQLSAEFGITGPQLLALREASRLGEISVTALARQLHLSQSTMTGIVQRLGDAGLIKRVRKVKDRRERRIAVSRKGEKLLDRSPPLLQSCFREELERLEEYQRTALLANLQHIAAMMDAADVEAAPVLTTGEYGAAPRKRGSKRPAS